MTVTVLELRDMNAPESKTVGCLRAYATIQVGPLVIHRVCLIKQPGQKAYCAPPQIEWHDGKRVQYFPIVQWPNDWKGPIFSAVWEAYCAQRGTETDDRPSPQLVLSAESQGQ